MTDDRLSPDERALFALLPRDGTRIGNIRARRELGWDDERYDRARGSLLRAGLVETGPGRGGTVGRRIDDSIDDSPDGAAHPRSESGDEERATPLDDHRSAGAASHDTDGTDAIRIEPVAPSPFIPHTRAPDGVVKLVHAADIHLDSPLRGLERYPGAPVDAMRGATRRALENLVLLCEEERAHLLLIAGDLYDGDWQDYGTGLFFAQQMARLRDLGVRVLLVRGNHDAQSRISRHLRLPDNVHTFSAHEAETKVFDDLGVAVHGRSYARPQTTEDLAATYPKPVPTLLNVGLLHTSTDGRPLHDPYAPCSPLDLAAKGYDYWALGHVHARETLRERPWIVFPGNLQGRHARETGPKGCMLVTADGGEIRAVEHRPVDVVRWLDLRVDAEGCVTETDALERIESALRRHALGVARDACAVRIRLTGRTRAHLALERHEESWHAAARSFATEVSGGTVWLEKILLETTPEREVALGAASTGPIAELMAELEAIRDRPDRLEALAESLKDMYRRLPAAARDGDEAIRLDADFVRAALRDAEGILLPRLLDEEV